MWERIRRELLIEYYWWRRHSAKKRQLDSPIGVVGILCITSGFFLLIIIGQAFGSIYRNMIPLVSGAQVAGAYWSSVLFALKVSLVLMVFLVAIIVALYLKFSSRRRK